MKITDNCRSCGSGPLETVLDLGLQPLANSLRKVGDLRREERKYPLTLAQCPECRLLQLREEVPPDDMFRDYPYFSSVSPSIVQNAKGIAERLAQGQGLHQGSLVIEAASNDGYLLQHYQARGIPVLGIDPALNVAAEANKRGVPTLPEYFGTELADRLVAEGKRCDVFHANNVLAHVPDLNGFVEGIARILKQEGMACIEVPHAAEMIDHTEFDTIYHEHLCYFSLRALIRLFSRHGLRIVHAEKIPIHGGTLRFFAKRSSSDTLIDKSVSDVLYVERIEESLPSFVGRVNKIGTELWRAICLAKIRGGRVAAYGASAKGSTLLNYFGIDNEVIDFVVDKSPHKQGLFTPGTCIPIFHPDELARRRPSYTLLLTWNFEKEIVSSQQEYIDSGGVFIVPVPAVRLVGRMYNQEPNTHTLTMMYRDSVKE